MRPALALLGLGVAIWWWRSRAAAGAAEASNPHAPSLLPPSPLAITPPPEIQVRPMASALPFMGPTATTGMNPEYLSRLVADGKASLDRSGNVSISDGVGVDWARLYSGGSDMVTCVRAPCPGGG